MITKNTARFKTFIFLLFSLLQIFAISCSSPSNSSEPQVSKFYQSLKKTNGITSVTPIEQDEQKITKAGGKQFKEKYLVKIKQPVSWNTPALGSFEQRLIIGYSGKDKPVVFCCNGYMIDDDSFSYTGSTDALVKILDANYILVEYRFFGESIPQGFTPDGTAFYKHLTSKNACDDLHSIREKLKDVFPLNWLSNGGSKGGYTTETYAMYWPDDCKVYIPYVAPICDGREDTKFHDFVYNHAGDSVYGDATNYRKIIMEYINECLINKEEIAKCAITEFKYPETTPLEDIYLPLEKFLADFPTWIWQYQVKEVDSTKDPKILTDLKEKILKRKVAKENKNYHKYCNNLLKFLMSAGFSLNEEDMKPFLPYYYQSWCEIGNYKIQVNLANQKLADYEFEGRFTISEDQVDLFNDSFNEAQKAAFSSIPESGITEMRDALINWRKTSMQNVIFIHGIFDPWRAVSFCPDTDPIPLNTSNPNMYEYVNPNYGHGANINNSFNEADNEKYTNLVKAWMNEY